MPFVQAPEKTVQTFEVKLFIQPTRIGRELDSTEVASILANYLETNPIGFVGPIVTEEVIPKPTPKVLGTLIQGAYR